MPTLLCTVYLSVALPEGLDENDIMERIAPGKDVDGFGPVSLGHLVLDQPGFLACTPHGVIKLLDAYQSTLRESMPLLSAEASLSANRSPCCFSAKMRRSRFVIAEQPILWKSADRPTSCASPSESRIHHGRYGQGRCGGNRHRHQRCYKRSFARRCRFRAGTAKGIFVTPVPGGVGPLTIAMLMQNPVLAAEMLTQ